MKILLVKTSSLGDIIHTFPTLQYLREKFPKAQIDWVVEKPYAELVQAHPDVTDVLRVDTKTWRKNLFKKGTWQDILNFRKTLREVKYDVVFDLQGNIKSGLLCTRAHAKIKVGFGKETVPEWPNLLFTDRHYNPPQGLNIREDYLHLAQSYFDDKAPYKHEGVLLKLSGRQQASLQVALQQPIMLDEHKVLVCAGSAWRNKQMERSALVDFLKLLKSHLNCSYLFAWGSAEEKLFAEDLQSHFLSSSSILEKLSLPALQNIMARCELVIAMDSLPLHLAGTTSTKTFSIFGASSADKYKPEGPQHIAYQGRCPYGRIFVKRCPVLRSCSTGACIRTLSGQSLFHFYLKSLTNSSPTPYSF